MSEKHSHNPADANSEVDADKGKTPDNAFSWVEAFHDFVGNGVADKFVRGVKSDLYFLAARGRMVEDSAKVSLNAMEKAWAGSSVYDC